MEMINKVKKNKLLPFIAILFIFGIYDCLILPCYADDINLYTGILEKQTIWEFMSFRYSAWSSRIIIEAVLVYMVKYQILWRILNTLVAFGIAWYMSKLVSEDHKYSWPICFGVVMYPFIDMSTAGWIATMLNYWWPLFTLLVLAYYLKQIMLGNKMKWYQWMISFIFAVFTCDHEQAATVVLLLFGGCFCYFFIKNKKISLYMVMVLIVDVVSYVYIMLCPGNSKRLVQSDGEIYNKFSLVKKLELGIFNIENRFWVETNIFMIVFIFVLVYLMWKTRMKTRKFWVCMPMMIIILGYQVTNRLCSVSKMVFVEAERTMDLEAFEVASLIKVFWFVLFVASLLACFWVLLKEEKNNVLSVLIAVISGFGSAEMLGMSPTVFTSDTRIFIFFYFSLIYALGMCVKSTYGKIQYVEFERIVIDLMIFAITGYQVMYVVSNIIGRRHWKAIPIDFEIGKAVVNQVMHWL
ncbi:MAG: hypothetical protein IIT46_13755 [Lachnospiraceae bacterium]|nr:hypothetical protein [Lachnospiraceae bacterium]